MGRRIPSFEKIEKIASALHINAYQLFIDEQSLGYEDKELNTKDYLENMPVKVKKEIASTLAAAIHNDIGQSLDPKNYK